MAMVYGLLCRQAGLDCRVVSGTSSGRQWYWNIVELDGRYCHVDLLTDLEGDQLVLRYDEDMTDYVWNTKNYPACPKPEPPATEPGRGDDGAGGIGAGGNGGGPDASGAASRGAHTAGADGGGGSDGARNDRPRKCFPFPFTKPAFAAYNKQSMKKECERLQ